MLPDFKAPLADRQAPLIIAGDLNVPMYDLLYGFQRLATGDLVLTDPFAQLNPVTFQQREGGRSQFKMDYLNLSKCLARKVTERRGGINDFPSTLALSDHAPLLVEIVTDLDSAVCRCGAVLRRPAGNSATSTRCPKCGQVIQTDTLTAGAEERQRRVGRWRSVRDFRRRSGHGEVRVVTV